MKTIRIKSIFKKYIPLIADILSILAFFGVWINLITIFQTQKDVSVLTQKLNQQEAQQTLRSYFFYVEQHDFQSAFNLFTEEKKSQHTYSWFVNWLWDFLSFEWLKILELPEKDSASQKVFIAEFGFKKRGKLSVDTKRWFYLKYDGKDWKINYSNVLYDWKNRDKWACNFYKFEHCQ